MTVGILCRDLSTQHAWRPTRRRPGFKICTRCKVIVQEKP